MNLLRISRPKPTVVVGLDFGTTFSGFAYALTSKPEECQLFYEWPGLKEAGASNYCKTQTSLLYSDVAGKSRSSESYQLQSWGYEALLQHAQGTHSQETTLKACSDVKRTSKSSQLTTLKACTDRKTISQSKVEMKADIHSGVFGHFVTRFKLHLARGGKTSAADLPEGLTPRRTISDYLRKLSEFIIGVLHNSLGSHIKMEDIQWCLTVPAIWDEAAKQEMKACAEIAGLVEGPHCEDESASPHPIIVVLEPEAASFYCQRKSDYPLNDGDKFLVVDAGGGTVDLALHEKVGSPWSKKVREVAPSSGGLCGGTYVDERFFKFLSKKIKCFERFAEDQPQTVLKLQSEWEPIKCKFDGNMRFDYTLDLPAKLALAWELEEEGLQNAQPDGTGSYDSIVLTLEDMLNIFDPVVDQILQLIYNQIIPDLKALMIVGGFAASPYLINRIKAAFSQQLAPGIIIFPKEPGSAICCGAVAYGAGGPDLIMSRISKKTYGISIVGRFPQGDPEYLTFFRGYTLRSGVFKVFAKKGETVPVDSCVTHSVSPVDDDQIEGRVSVFSSSDTDPKYVTDPGVSAEGSFLVDFPSRDALGMEPEIRVSMFFGRAMIEVTASGANFGQGEKFEMPPVRFERSYERMSPKSKVM